MFCFHGSANLTSGPLASQTAFYLHRCILQRQNLHALKTHSSGFTSFSSLSTNHVDLTFLQQTAGYADYFVLSQQFHHSVIHHSELQVCINVCQCYIISAW